MNTRIFSLVVVLSAVTFQTARADGYPIATVSDFYEPLGAVGHWVEMAPYGWCWYPARVDSDWRPYANGHWLWSDDGWYWVSEEPWAWACYHYGRWVWNPDYGWLWVPATEWAPAWVTWREGGGYVGWAPLPPETIVYVDHVVVVPELFVFVQVNNFCRPIRPSCVIVNRDICHKTVVCPDIRRPDRRVVTHGPRFESTGQPTVTRKPVVSTPAPHRMPVASAPTPGPTPVIRRPTVVTATGTMTASAKRDDSDRQPLRRDRRINIE